MTPKRLRGLLILSVLALSILAFGKVQVKENVSSLTSHESLPSQPSAIPDHVVYGLLFKRVSRLSEKTQELRSQGRIPQQEYHPMQKEASLNEAQARTLEAIASACQKEVALQDERARGIIGAFRDRFPGGKIPQGAVLPPPPPELFAMSKERDAIILRARDQLRTSFGESSFDHFDNFVKFRFRPKTVSRNSGR